MQINVTIQPANSSSKRVARVRDGVVDTYKQSPSNSQLIRAGGIGAQQFDDMQDAINAAASWSVQGKPQMAGV